MYATCETPNGKTNTAHPRRRFIRKHNFVDMFDVLKTVYIVLRYNKNDTQIHVKLYIITVLCVEYIYTVDMCVCLDITGRQRLLQLYRVTLNWGPFKVT